MTTPFDPGSFGDTPATKPLRVAEEAAAGPLARTTPYDFLCAPLDDDEIGRLGNYRVLRRLGEGGMGVVFHAEDLTLRRPVALKVMKPGLKGDGDTCQRFLREARSMAALGHEHLVTVYQAGQEGDVFYLAMQLLEGETLDDWMRRSPSPSVPEVLRIGREIASGLAVIHGYGLVHRDIKPANIWLEGAGRRVKILDFGLARLVQENTHLTESGMVLGTPAFMSPEQARGEALDARSDLFSLGCVLYALCTGFEPFQGKTTTAILTALALTDPPPIHKREPRFPRALSDLIMSLLAKRPEDRPASAKAVLEALSQIEAKPSARAVPSAPARGAGRRRKRLALAFVVVALVSFAASMGAVPTLLGLPTTESRERKAESGTKASPPPPTLPVPSPAIPLQPPAVPLPTPRVETVYLSDLEPIERRLWDFRPPPPPRGVKGPPPGPPPVAVRGKPSPHGIFMHPPPPGPEQGPVYLRYRLGKQYQTFQAEVSLNDGPGGPQESENPLTFIVFGDGRELWRSRPVSSQRDTQPCLVSVEGVERLTFAVYCEGHVHGAHAVWVEPRLNRLSSPSPSTARRPSGSAGASGRP